MSAIYELNRPSLWLHSSEFPCTLNYSIKNNQAIFDNKNISTLDNDSIVTDTHISYYDVQDIDVRCCTFDEFCKAIKFAKESCSSFNYDDELLLSFKGRFGDDEVNNFFQFFEDYRLKCAHDGNMDLYYKIVPIAQAGFNMSYISDNYMASDLTSNGYFKTNIFNDDCCLGFYDNYYLGWDVFDIAGNTYQITSEYDIESTAESPIINVRIRDYISNTELEGSYLININSIDIEHATPIEIFALLSYKESLDNPNWEKDYPLDTTFKKLINSGAFNLEGLSDFTEQQFNLITLLENAKVEIQNKGVQALNQFDFSIVTKSYTEKYIEQCEEAFDRILFSLSKRE